MVHHIILYSCSSAMDDPNFTGEGYPCFRADSKQADIPIEFPSKPLVCNTWIASWAKGGDVSRHTYSELFYCLKEKSVLYKMCLISDI